MNAETQQDVIRKRVANYEVFTPYEPAPSGNSPTITLREEQKKAIADARKYFEKGLAAKRTQLKFLWNAKMRFGKTLCALQLAKEMNFRRTLIVTHRPLVMENWEDDFRKIFPADGHYGFGTKSEDDGTGDFHKLEQRASQPNLDFHYVFFVSMQYLRLSGEVRNQGDDDPLKKTILDHNWDLVVVDEAHEGTCTDLGTKVIQRLSKDRTCVLHLSGTPFILFDDFQGDNIFTWDYVMEQEAKRQWHQDHPNAPNPYEPLPTMHILTYDLGKLTRGPQGDVADNAVFKLSEFFRVWTGDRRRDRKPLPSSDAIGHFVHEEQVRQFLDLLACKNDQSNYPFSTEAFRRGFRHTLWVVPGVKEAAALQKLLERHSIFHRFKVVNVAGNCEDDETRDDALKQVKTAISQTHDQTNTITLSCGRLTTGTTIPEWTAVLYLKGSDMTQAATYMQTIFRVQTPYVQGNRMKANCFVFDFAPDRALKALAETFHLSERKHRGVSGGKDEVSEEERSEMETFLTFCPVIAMDGGAMHFHDSDSLCQKLKEAHIDRVVTKGFDDAYLYNTDTLMKLDDHQVEKLNRLRGIIAQTTSMDKPKPATSATVLAHNGLSPQEQQAAGRARKKKQEQKELTPEEKEALEKEKKEKEMRKKERDKRISILRGISLRIPLMIFGATLTDEDTGITIDNFTDIIDDESWAEFMPRGITKQDFKTFSSCYNYDVFNGAGKRIRALTRDADFLSVEERIRAITTIHGYFRNPDKETVLTPWRVVNMHLSSTLGGYCFFNETFDGPNTKLVTDDDGNSLLVETAEPRLVTQPDVTADLFGPGNPKTGDTSVRILEINSKTGLYPLYVAYSLYRGIRDAWKSACTNPTAPSSTEETVIWDNVLAKNIFVVCNTPMAARITERTLRGFRTDIKLHIKNTQLIQQAKQEDKFLLVNRLIKEKFWFDNQSDSHMKFNAVVGNPPYQENPINAGGRANPIYDKFMEIAFQLAPKVTLITPGRFLSNAGQTPKAWNEKMLNDPHLKVIMYNSKSSYFFPSVDIKGG